VQHPNTNTTSTNLHSTTLPIPSEPQNHEEARQEAAGVAAIHCRPTNIDRKEPVVA
jgi:hypothetical protein